MRSIHSALLVGLVGLFVFAGSASAALTVTTGLDPSNPLSNSLYVDPNIGAQNVPIAVFNASASGGPAAITSLTINPILNIANGDFDPASSMTLVSNGQAIASESITGTPSASVTFTNIQGLVIPSGATEPITVEVNVPSPSLNYNETGTTAVSATLSGVTYEDLSGKNYGTNPNISANPQYFFSAVPNLQFISGSTNSTVTKNGVTQTINGTISVSVTPQGGVMTQPTASDFEIGVGTSLAQAEANIIPSAQTTILSIAPLPASNTAPLSADHTYTLQLGATALPSEFFGDGSYEFYVLSAMTTMQNPEGAPVMTDQTWGLNNFTSGSVAVNTSVPEPGSISLLACGALVLLKRRRRTA